MREALRRAAAAAAAAGRDALLEHEGLAVLAAMGVGVPRHAVLRDARAVPDLAEFTGDRVVVKAESAAIPHKTEAGAVRIVPRHVSTVASALLEMDARLRGVGVESYLVEEFVPHRTEPGCELLLGVRRTEDFGAVVTLGPGGVHAEFLARTAAEGRGPAILSPALASPAAVAAALAPSAAFEAATRPHRGRAAPWSEDAVRDLVQRFLALAEAAVDAGLVEFEANPVVPGPRGAVALDALGRFGRPRAAPPPPRPLDRIANLLRPRRIAIAGVSRGANPGRIILTNVLAAGFPPESVVVVKPGATEIDGCRCVPDVASIDGCVDLLVVAVDAERAAAATEDAVRLGKAASVILVPGGMGERAGSSGHADRVRAALDAARATPGRGPVVNGPNCLGVRSVPGRYDTLFIPRHKLRFPDAPPAPLAVLSQSGAFAVSWASRLGALNPRYVVTMGNQADLTAADYLEHLADDPEVRVFACYVEGFRPGDGARWLQAAARITRSGRTVVLYRAGRSAEGAAASASHTASVAGDYAVCRALAATAGVLVAESLADFTDMTRLACAFDGLPVAGTRLGAMSNAGFECVAIADHAGTLRLAEFCDATRARLAAALDAARLGSIVGVRNPLDVTPILGDAAFAECAAAVLDDPGVDVGVIGCVPLSGALQTLAAGDGHAEDVRSDDSVVRRLARLRADARKPWVAVVDAGPDYDAMAAALDAAGVPTFRHADRALSVLGRWCAARLRGCN